MYNSVLSQTLSSCYDTVLTTDPPRRRFKRLPPPLKSSPADFASAFQISWKDPADSSSQPFPSDLLKLPPFGPAHPIPNRDCSPALEDEFMHCDGAPAITQHRGSISSSSGSSSVPTSPLELPFPVSPRGIHDDKHASETVDDEPWNLVAYQIPWGPAYEGYKAGTLPGPDGPCIFLRSPTPSKKQRTSQACEKCRERKAKCSGGRPACARCDARGHACIYTSAPTFQGQDCSPPLMHRSISGKDSLPETENNANSHGSLETRPDDKDVFEHNGPSNSVQQSAQSTPAAPLSHNAHQQPPNFSSLFCATTAASPRTSANTLQVAVDSRSELDDYRFPPPSSPLTDTRTCTIANSQSQSQSNDPFPPFWHLPSDSGAVFGNMRWLGGLDEFPEENSLLPGPEIDAAYFGPLSAASINSLPHFPGSYSGAFAGRDFHPSCGTASEGVLLNPTFANPGYDDPYNAYL